MFIRAILIDRAGEIFLACVLLCWGDMKKMPPIDIFFFALTAGMTIFTLVCLVLMVTA